jgi:putative membrane protein
MMEVVMGGTLALIAGGEWGGWPWLAPLWLLFWALVLFLVVRFALGRRRWRGGPADPLAEARSILAQRFARGEIDAEEYRGRLAELGH